MTVQKIVQHQTDTPTTVVQIGCGVVGHAYVQAYKSKNVNTICIEVNPQIIMNLENQGFEVYKSGEVPEINDVSFVFLCICTPFNQLTNKLDMKYLDSTLDTVAGILANNPEALVVIRSTINLGYSSLYKQRLSEKIGCSVEVCYQPEFLRAKTALEDAMNPWSVVIGCESYTPSIERLTEFYSMFLSKDKIEVLSIDEAELMKVVHNSFNAAKISYFNQVYLLCNKINENKHDDLKIDCNKMLKVMSKTCEGLINPMYGMTAGHGYYGACLPKDSKELARLEKLYKLDIPMFRNVTAINEYMVNNVDSEEHLYGDNQLKANKFN